MESKTRAYRQMENYIESAIESMNHSVEYAATIEKYSRDDKIRYALRSIEEARDRARGALVYAAIYMEDITEKEYRKLDGMLDKEFWRLDREAFEIN